MLNMILGVICVSLSLPMGILLALGRQSSLPIIKLICVVFIEFIRGVPLITLLFVANVVLAYFLFNVGFFVDDEEFIDGCRCVAMPVTWPEETGVAAALSVTMPTSRTDARWPHSMVEPLRRTVIRMRAPIFNSFSRIVVLCALACAVPARPSRRKPCNST